MFAESELTKTTVAFQWQTPLLAQSYCGRLTMEETCELKGNTQIDKWGKEERQERVCTE
jgi:hypothetical protein